MEIKDAESPTHCPACQSRDLITASKKVDAETYWRCVKCGEVWNVERLEAGSGRYRRDFGR